MLAPNDYGKEALTNETTRALMNKIEFEHGGEKYDKLYPEGIPTSVVIETEKGSHDSGLVMFPAGHARNTTADLGDILQHKFKLLGKLALEKNELI